MTPADRADVMHPAGHALRFVRSLAVALVCVTAAALGHLTADGALPASSVLVVFVGSAAVAWLLSVRRVTPGQLLGLLLLCQAGVHLASLSAEMSMGPGMIAGHVAATAASALILARGERFVWQLAERLGLRLAPLLRAVAPFTGPRPASPVCSYRTVRDVFLTYSRSLRGPPVGAA